MIRRLEKEKKLGSKKKEVLDNFFELYKFKEVLQKSM